MLNIIDLTNHGIMLGMDVETYRQAYNWLEYYRTHYGKGVPYPNGEGEYNGEFIIVRRVEDSKYSYRPIQ